jgi:mono/diheme cytochrome c family protein
MTRPAVNSTVPANTLPFPLNIRAFQEGWKILFFRSARYQADQSKSADWNRGAYLAEGLADCTGCHTPRNPLGAEEMGRAYAGAVIEGWIAPALTEANPSPVPWTQEEMFTYLRTGVTSLHGATGATMTPVIRGALALPVVPDSDISAIALYFSGMDRASARANDVDAATREAVATSYVSSDQAENDPDADRYASACMSCHYNAGPTPLASRPELALNSSLMLAEPTNFVQVVLNGVTNTETVDNTQGAPGLVMPQYSSLTDGEIAGLAAYLRRTRTKLPPWSDLEKKVSAIRRDSAATR